MKTSFNVSVHHMNKSLILPLMYFLVISWCGLTLINGFRKSPLKQRLEQRDQQIQQLLNQ